MDSSPNAELERQKLLLEIEEKKKALAAKKPWWTAVVELLGIPAAVLGLVVAFTAASGNLATKTKTVAETAQIQKNLAQAEKQGPKAFEEAVVENADRIQAALGRLQLLEEQANGLSLQREILKFVILWIMFNMIGLIFDVIRMSWNTATSGIVYGLHALLLGTENDSDGVNKNRRKHIWQRRFTRFAPAIALTLNPLPDILRWSIQLTIFATLLKPLFNGISILLGSHVTFDEVFRELRQLHFGAMLRKVHDMLFG